MIFACFVWDFGQKLEIFDQVCYFLVDLLYFYAYFVHSLLKSRGIEDFQQLSTHFGLLFFAIDIWSIQHVWDLKQRDQNYEIKWSIVDRASDFNPTTRKCRLCLKEKFYIIFQPEGATLNRRSELFTTYRHRLRLTLANTKEDDFL